MKLVLIIPYFGKISQYFELFLLSCKYNASVDFLIITDNAITFDSSNVRIIRSTFAEFSDRIRSCYDFDIILDEPYKLCDYKVAYGEVLGEYISEYDFWGFCDCDLIFGDIRKFVTEELLNRYDKLYMRGHFTLFRNNGYINRLYRMNIDGESRYKYCFQNAGTHHFDEGLPDQVKGINMIFAKAGIEIYDHYDFMDLEVQRYDFIQSDLKETEAEQKLAQYSYFNWENGKLYRLSLIEDKIECCEYMYIHFQKRKMHISKRLLKCMIEEKKNCAFTIVPNKFIAFCGLNKKFLLRANPKKIYWARLISRGIKKCRKIVERK